LVTPREALEILSQKFLMQPGVSGVSVVPGSAKIRVYVETEEDARRVPPRLLGYYTEVYVAGRIRLLEAPPEPATRGRVRPLVGGVSTGCCAATGTLTLALRDPHLGRTVLLSCRHVYWGGRGSRVLQPGPLDGGGEGDAVGYVWRWTEVEPPPRANRLDLALAVATVEAREWEVMLLGRLSGFSDPVVGSSVEKVGRTTGLTSGRVIDAWATVKVYGYPWGYSIFVNQAVAEMPAEPGDSGSPVASGGRLVGVLFAGSERVAVFNKASDVESFLKPGLQPQWLLGLAPVAATAAIIASEEYKRRG
jgi:hypothetical protein